MCHTPLIDKASESHRSEMEGALDKVLDQYPDILTVQEVCKILRISKTMAYRMLKTGQLSSRRIGSSYRISKESLISFIQGI